MTTRPRLLSARLASVAALLAMLWAATVTGSAFARSADALERRRDSNLTYAAQQNIARVECLIYAVYDAELADSQFMTISLGTNEVTPIGPLYTDYDIEGIDIDPSTDILYAVSGSDNRQNQQGYLYQVDAVTGELFAVGATGFEELPALSIRPTDNSIWGWSEGDGLITINKATGAGTLSTSSNINIEGLAWTRDGTILYGVAGSRLYQITPGGAVRELARNLPGSGQVESLEMRADGLLMGGFHKAADLNIFAYDPVALQPVREANITTPYNDIESIAYPERCGTPDEQPTPTPTTPPTATATPVPTATETTPTPATTPTGTLTATPTTSTPPTSTPTPPTSATGTPTPVPSASATPTPEADTPPPNTPTSPPPDETPAPTSTPVDVPSPTSTPTTPPSDGPPPTSTPVEQSSPSPTAPPAETPTPTAVPPAQPPAAPPAGAPPAQPAAPVAGGADQEEPQTVLGATEEDEPAASRPRAALSNLGAESALYAWLFGLAVAWISLGVALRLMILRRP